MELVHIKVVLLLKLWLFASGTPLAMLQHPTSSQSIVFHQPQGSSSQSGTPQLEHFGGNQPKYEYKYEVSDHQTGDRKSHWESRDGDKVRGVYTLYEPDGALRTVEYTADALHGFNAVVRRDEPNSHLHRQPQNSYQGSSGGIHDGYETSASSSKYSSDQIQGRPYDRPSSSGYIPGVGYSVNHFAGPRNNDNLIKPY